MQDKDQQPNPLLEILLCVILPTFLLTKGTKHISKFIEDDVWGPRSVLLLALAIPIGYGIYDFLQRKKFNLFAILGIVGVILTGAFGLGGAKAEHFAAKEALMPILLASALLLSHLGKNPLIKSILMNPQLFALDRINEAIESKGAQSNYKSLLFKGSLGLAGTMLLSSVANWFLAMHFLKGITPGTEEYNEAIGKTIGWGFAVIGIPLMIASLGVFWFFLKGLSKVTGLDTTELTTEGSTVRRKNTPTHN